jgi:hypothetical protein
MESLLLQGEECKIIEEFPNYYITTFGRVYSINKKRFLSNHTPTQQIYLSKDKKSCGRQIYRLVAQAFIPNFNPKLQIDHIDRNISNNCLSNLRVVSRRQNGLNKKRYCNNTSGETNISERKKDHGFIVMMRLNNGKLFTNKHFTYKKDGSNREEILKKAVEWRDKQIENNVDKQYYYRENINDFIDPIEYYI